MSMIFDPATVKKGFQRAAQMAKHGTREEKSGRFLPPPGWKGHLVTGEDVAPAPAKRARR